LWKAAVHYLIHSSPAFVTLLSQMNPVQYTNATYVMSIQYIPPFFT